MAATITPGIVFTDGQTVTHTDLNNITGGASIAGIDRTNFASTTRPVVVSTTAPASVLGEHWFDISQNPAFLKVYDGNVFRANGRNEIVLQNKNYAASTLNEGDVVVQSTGFDSALDLPTTRYQSGIIGVIAADVVSDGQARIVTNGVARVNFKVGTALTGARGQWVFC